MSKKSFDQPFITNERQQNVKTILGFKYDQDRKYYIGNILNPFKPIGLMLFYVPPKTWIRQTLIGNQLQIVAGWDPIPADLFTMGHSFEQIEKLIDEGIEPPTWPEFDSAYIGNLLRVELIDDDDNPVGPPARVAMWGLSAR